MNKVLGKEVQLPDPKDNIAVIRYVKKALLEQNAMSIEYGICRYRSKGRTLACAAGHLILDEDYDNNNFSEGSCICIEEDDVNKNNFITTYFRDRGYNLNLLADMQNIHDAFNPQAWEKKFNLLEEEYTNV